MRVVNNQLLFRFVPLVCFNYLKYKFFLSSDLNRKKHGNGKVFPSLNGKRRNRFETLMEKIRVLGVRTNVYGLLMVYANIVLETEKINLFMGLVSFVWSSERETSKAFSLPELEFKSIRRRFIV